MPLWGVVIVALGAIGLYAFGVVVIGFALPEEPSNAQIMYACFWPVYPLVRVAVAMFRLAERIGRSIRARREIPTATARQSGRVRGDDGV